MDKGGRIKLSKRQIINIVTVVLAVGLVVFWGVLAFITLNSSKSGSWEEEEPVFVAHRGYSDKYFENTLQAFEAAGKEKFFGAIETDVRRTADGVYVCSHDDTPFRDKTVSIAASKFDDIKALPLDTAHAEGVAAEEYRIARLSEFLNVCKRYRKVAFVEIKEKLAKEDAEALSEYALGIIGSSGVVFCGFDKATLDHIYNKRQYLKIQLFTAKTSKAKLYAEMGYNVSVNKKGLTKSAVKKAHNNGVWIGAYTVTDAAEARRLYDAGVDYITVNGVLAIN